MGANLGHLPYPELPKVTDSLKTFKRSKCPKNICVYLLCERFCYFGTEPEINESKDEDEGESK